MNRKALKEKLRGHTCDDCFFQSYSMRLSAQPKFCLNKETKPEENICGSWAEDYLSTEQLMKEDRAEYAKSIDVKMRKALWAKAAKQMASKKHSI